MANNILINGINYSWGDIQLVLFGVPVRGCTKVEYKTKQNKTNNYGIGVKPISRGYGNEEYEGSIELYMDEWKGIIANSPNKNPMQIAPFPITVLFGSSRAGANVVKLQKCEFLESGFTANQGDTSLKVTIPLIIGGIEEK